ncbi:MULTISPECIES: beta-ketoacyl-ACP synthase III [unclassified Granulicatella]|uniref:beta-ketoacyl-ACP synthase III n=1 Tax=unclassified Granulicatella TaxID=2630493 RepID=UPI001073B17F|nr:MULTISPECIES: beta-ketoacyl-ACP synthase III [unclassified Granulicatella]MBF0780888.1 ketoacyl-ACP synthase III [Granulicatella sp. 19428wC4_WM01]TFU93239.1 ketoacyl-ACP synthase III [Granulicatella sp. WM01]
MGVKIIATGAYVPSYRVSNTDLECLLDTTDEWIQQRTGIISRHISQGENTSDLGYYAAKMAIEQANIDVAKIDFIIVATMSADYNTPSTACLIQEKLDANNAFACDINAACSGFVYALHIARSLMDYSTNGYGLVIGSEVMSKLLNWNDRSTAILFGDGAGCVLLEKSVKSNLLSHVLHSDGEKGLSLCAVENPVCNPFVDNEKEVLPFLRMNGRDIFNFSTRQIPTLILETVEKAECTLDDIDYFLIHQANLRIIELVAKKLDVPLDKFPTNVEHYGNTSSASIPILLDELIQQRKIVLNGECTILMAGFGGGLTWGALLIRI